VGREQWHHQLFFAIGEGNKWWQLIVRLITACGLGVTSLRLRIRVAAGECATTAGLNRTKGMAVHWHLPNAQNVIFFAIHLQELSRS
jgi:hypothetical protein